MKKLAIVLAALLLACVFVGCGASNVLKNTTWTVDKPWGGYDVVKFEFKENDAVTLYEGAHVTDLTWSCDGFTLTIMDGEDLYGEYTVEFTGKDKMTWTQTKPDAHKDEVLTLTKVVEDAE